MKIEGSASICEVFSIFHDGGIIHCHEEQGSLLLKIDIEYLAKRIDPDFRKFAVFLEDVKDIHFTTWPRDVKAEPRIMREIESIVDPELEIFEGRFDEGLIQVVCIQDSPKCDYFGGVLCLSASSAEVTDEGGKSYSLDELVALCRGYWDEWSRKNQA